MDPTSGYTALHWAAKQGSEDVVKLVAGTYGLSPNVRTNGGYTPLHLAMQYGHEDIFNLLVQVYGADQNLRDWSGRKPRQYQINVDTSVSADTFRSKLEERRRAPNLKRSVEKGVRASVSYTGDGGGSGGGGTRARGGYRSGAFLPSSRSYSFRT